MEAGTHKKWVSGLVLMGLWMGLREPHAGPLSTRSDKPPRKESGAHPRVVSQTAQGATDPVTEWSGSDTHFGNPLDTAADTGNDTGAVDEEPETTQLYVTVIDSEGEIVDTPVTVLLSCRGYRMGSGYFRPLQDGQRFQMSITWSESNRYGCSISSAREDGLLKTRSDSIELSPEEGPEVEVELVLPVEPTGGLGLQIVAHQLGIEAVGVLPGSPAAAAGLEAGDIISSIEGWETQGMRTDTFVELATGEIGSWVEFAYLSSESDRETETSVQVQRQWLE